MAKQKKTEEELFENEEFLDEEDELIFEESDEDEDDEDESDDEDEDDEDDEDEVKKESFDFSSDVEALMEGEELPESFKEKASIIFEAALTSKMTVLREELMANAQAEIDRQVNEQTDATIELMVSTVDKYISHIAEEWMKENELAVEHGIKTELAENFMSGLRNLFVENYIEIPEEKVDVVESLTSEVLRLKQNLDEAIELNISLKDDLSEKVKKEIVQEMAEDLSLFDQEKFFHLTEDLEMHSESSFRKKLDTLKESYFGKKGSTSKSTSSQLEEDIEFLGSNIDETDDEEKTLTKMDIYAQALAPKIDPRFLGR